jgi:hypothetical protein
VPVAAELVEPDGPGKSHRRGVHAPDLPVVAGREETRNKEGGTIGGKGEGARGRTEGEAAGDGAGHGVDPDDLARS